MTKTEQQQLREVLYAIYETRQDEICISPAWLATEAMIKLDPDRISPPLVYLAAHLELRQLSREMCRRKIEEDGPETDQHELFPGLQARYPVDHAPDSEPRYIRLEHMTEADKNYNVQRLRREAAGKQAHADALEAWWQDRTAAA